MPEGRDLGESMNSMTDSMMFRALDSKQCPPSLLSESESSTKQSILTGSTKKPELTPEAPTKQSNFPS